MPVLQSPLTALTPVMPPLIACDLNAHSSVCSCQSGRLLDYQWSGLVVQSRLGCNCERCAVARGPGDAAQSGRVRAVRAAWQADDGRGGQRGHACAHVPVQTGRSGHHPDGAGLPRHSRAHHAGPPALPPRHQVPGPRWGAHFPASPRHSEGLGLPGTCARPAVCPDKVQPLSHWKLCTCCCSPAMASPLAGGISLPRPTPLPSRLHSQLPCPLLVGRGAVPSCCEALCPAEWSFDTGWLSWWPGGGLQGPWGSATPSRMTRT